MNSSVTAHLKAMPWRTCFLVMLVMMFTVSCGMFGIGKKKKEKEPTYYAAREVPALTIPEGYDRPSNTNALMIQTPPAPLPSQELKAVPPRVTSQSENKDENASVRWGNEGIYLLVQDTQSSVNRRLSHAAKRSGMTYREEPSNNSMVVRYVHVRTKNPDEGWFSKLAFWRDDGPDYSGEYLITTEADGENTRIYVRNADGSDADQSAAEYLLVKLDERLG